MPPGMAFHRKKPKPLYVGRGRRFLETKVTADVWFEVVDREDGLFKWSMCWTRMEPCMSFTPARWMNGRKRNYAAS